MRLMPISVLIGMALLCSPAIQAQDNSEGVSAVFDLPGKFFQKLQSKTQRLNQALDRQTGKYLSKLQRQENRIRKKLWKKDSTLSKQLFDGINEKYAKLKNTTGIVGRYQNVYSGHLDSLSTALHFLKDKDLTNNPALRETLNRYKELQLKLNASEHVKQYLVQRRELLKKQFEQLGMIKKLKKFRKEVFYYQAQVREYKQMFEEPNRVEATLMKLAMKIPQFKDFFAKNSMLGSLFALPGNSNINSTAIISGLQTRSIVNQSIVDRFGPSFNVTQQLQQGSQGAQGQLNLLKSKFSSLLSGSYSNGDADFPKNSRVNAQKTKSFFRRIEVGTNIQTQRASYLFPVTSDIGLSLNYKLNDQALAGVGVSGAIGWGTGWRNIQLTYQGVGVRSSLDWKLKGSFYISGGYEMNYRSLIHSVAQLKDYSAWQVSGLVGFSKKYQISKKMKGELKLLWDFMSYQQIPRAQPILFRVGYSLK